MPSGDGTGPAGAGPRTGRGSGYCTGDVTPGFTRAPRLRDGQGVGGGRRGHGGGRGRRNRFYATGLTGRQVPPAEPEPPVDEVAADETRQLLWRQAEALERLVERVERLESKN